jgi:hypothetical protein
VSRQDIHARLRILDRIRATIPEEDWYREGFAREYTRLREGKYKASDRPPKRKKA